MNYDDYAVRYIDRTGKTVQKSFKTAAARARFLDKGADSGAVSEVLAFSDPQ